MKSKVYSAEEHKIQKECVDPDALYVIQKLHQEGFIAYLVGGSVRDLLVQKTPKDFDISTSAQPWEIKRLFSNCLLIGRRFRLAHIRFGKKVFEVSTFRSGDPEGGELIVRDNKWGTPEEDVFRRDFTINGLFYDPEKNVVIDYVGGVEDVKKKLLRTIGNPVDRFKQDPVRMVRLLKFRARFGFKVDEETEKAMSSCRDEIVKSSQARILEETFKMLESGAVESFFRLAVETEILDFLYPALEHFLEGKYAEDIYKLLRAVDEIHNNPEETPIERSVLTTCLVFPLLHREIECQFLDKGEKPTIGEICELSHTLLRGFVTTSFPHFPRKLKGSINMIMDYQYRLTPRSQKRVIRDKIFGHEDFPAVIQFLRLRSIVDKEIEEDYLFWKEKFDQYKEQNPPPQKRRSRSHYRRGRSVKR